MAHYVWEKHRNATTQMKPYIAKDIMHENKMQMNNRFADTQPTTNSAENLLNFFAMNDCV